MIRYLKYLISNLKVSKTIDKIAGFKRDPYQNYTTTYLLYINSLLNFFH